jgi:PAS domain S-box-containing protein
VDAATLVGARRAVEHVLEAARRRLGMEAAFLAEDTGDDLAWRATTADADGFTILVGGVRRRLETFCQHVLDRGAAWVVTDAAEDPVASQLDITPVGRFGAYIGVPVRDSDGELFGTLCCISHEPRPELGERDVAVMEALAEVLGHQVRQLRADAEDRRLLEAAGQELAVRLRQQELQLGLLSQMLKAGGTPTLVVDPDTLRIDYANEAAAEFLGVPLDQVVGASLWEAGDRWTQGGVRGDLEPVLSGGTSVQRLVVDDVTPERRVLDVVVQRVSLDGEDAVLLVTAHDITDRRASEERLEQALDLERAAGEQLRGLDAMRNAFLTAVSHELRTPLTTVRLAAETLHAGRVGDDVAPLLLERLVANADRLDRLLGDLLDLNQFSHGQLLVERSEVRLDELVREAVRQVDLGDHRLVLDLEPVSALVAGPKVERIVVNLVLNATVHTRPCAITVRLTRTDGDALLVVEDEGPGVPPEVRRELFEPFRQGGTAPAHRPGTGIGLSLVAAFAELHGGHAWIDEAASGGAAFHVTLPIDG